MLQSSLTYRHCSGFQVANKTKYNLTKREVELCEWLSRWDHHKKLVFSLGHQHASQPLQGTSFFRLEAKNKECGAKVGSTTAFDWAKNSIWQAIAVEKRYENSRVKARGDSEGKVDACFLFDLSQNVKMGLNFSTTAGSMAKGEFRGDNLSFSLKFEV